MNVPPGCTQRSCSCKPTKSCTGRPLSLEPIDRALQRGSLTPVGPAASKPEGPHAQHLPRGPSLKTVAQNHLPTPGHRHKVGSPPAVGRDAAAGRRAAAASGPGSASSRSMAPHLCLQAQELCPPQWGIKRWAPTRNPRCGLWPAGLLRGLAHAGHGQPAAHKSKHRCRGAVV